MFISDPIKLIEEAAQTAGLRLEDIFNEAGVAFSNHSRWENNLTSPTYKTILRLQAGLHKLSKRKEQKRSKT